jgi:predicted TIM-barrel fold metal-dependent hydrolase
VKIGRFVVDTHVHAQRHAAGKALKEKAQQEKKSEVSYEHLSETMRHLTAYDNSDRLLFDMQAYQVDMCVLHPAFGMTNEINAQIVEKHPTKFVALCNAKKTQDKAVRGEESWTIEAAAAELDAHLATGKFVGIGEGIPGDNTRRRTISQTERLDEIRVVMEVARKHRVPVTIHTGVAIGYPLGHHFWPETLNPMWLIDIAIEYRDVPVILCHGGLQGWWSEQWVEQCCFVVAASDNVYLETGLWWTELYEKALTDPNIGAEKLMWGTDWGASIPLHVQPRRVPEVYAVQFRNKPVVPHQVDIWGWSLKQLWRLNVPQDDLNLIVGGNAVRLFKLPVPYTRLFRDVSPNLVPQSEKKDA